MTQTAAVYNLKNNSLLLFTKVTPSAKKNAIKTPITDADNCKRLQIHVTAIPDKGKANAAVIKLLAKTLKLPKTQLSIYSGQTSRFKTIEFSNPSADLADKLNALPF